MSVPLLEEELVVTKRVVVRERIVIRKRTSTEKERIDKRSAASAWRSKMTSLLRTAMRSLRPERRAGQTCRRI